VSTFLLNNHSPARTGHTSPLGAQLDQSSITTRSPRLAPAQIRNPLASKIRHMSNYPSSVALGNQQYQRYCREHPQSAAFNEVLIHALSINHLALETGVYNQLLARTRQVGIIPIHKQPVPPKLNTRRLRPVALYCPLTQPGYLRRSWSSSHQGLHHSSWALAFAQTPMSRELARSYLQVKRTRRVRKNRRGMRRRGVRSRSGQISREPMPIKRARKRAVGKLGLGLCAGIPNPGAHHQGARHDPELVFCQTTVMALAISARTAESATEMRNQRWCPGSGIAAYHGLDHLRPPQHS
jgi:hypothetical protein